MKLSLMLLAGLAAAASLRTRSAALRHWILATAIICAGAMPIMQRAVPQWTLNVVLPATTNVERPAVSVDVAINAGSARTVTAAPRVAAGAASWLGGIWMMGATLSLAVLGAGLARLAWLTSRGRRAPAHWTAAAEAIRAEHGLRRKIELIQSDHPSLLATWGILRPRIIFPAGASAWSDDLVRVVLRHEIAHIRRGDWLLQMAGELLRAVYWFNPLTWLACRRLRAESEQACDDDVLRAGTEPSDYAAHLLSLARQFSGHRTWLPAPAMARRSTLHRRVSVMLNSRIDRTPLALSARVATLAVLLAMTVALAAAQTSSTFSGTLLDPQGAVLPGVGVTLTNSDGKSQQTASNAKGQFQFSGLAPGAYVLEAQLPGFKSYKQSINISGANVVQTIALELGQVQETVTVVDAGDSPVPVTSEAEPRSKPACGQQPAAGAGAVRIGGNIRAPIKVKHVNPTYPASMRGKGGDVVLDAVIGTDGFVHDIGVHAGSQPEFVDAFVAAVTQWQFDATLLNCVAVETRITITAHFRPNGGI